MKKDLVYEFVNEVLRGFNLNKFKAISAKQRQPELEPDLKKDKETGTLVQVGMKKIHPLEIQTIYPEIEYAQGHLPLMGDGTSRIVFALSGDKALKIAKNEAGIDQNLQEVNFYKENSNNSLITKVFDSASDGKWIISEIARPLSEENLERYLGVSESAFQNLVRLIPRIPNFNAVDTITGLHNGARENANELENHLKSNFKKMKQIDVVNLRAEIRDLRESEKTYLSWLNNKTLLTFLTELYLIQKTKMEVEELARSQQWGLSQSGQIKLLDYGLTPTIFDKHYKEQ